MRIVVIGFQHQRALIAPLRFCELLAQLVEQAQKVLRYRVGVQLGAASYIARQPLAEFVGIEEGPI